MLTLCSLIYLSAYVALSKAVSQSCSTNFASVQIQSSLNSLPGHTITSERVNFAPYIYDQAITSVKLVPFAAQHTISVSQNNPCDLNTFTVPQSHYLRNIVVMEYDAEFFKQCSPQQWVLNLAAYGDVQAVLIANPSGSSHVYPLSGNVALDDPMIATRMISHSEYAKIQHVWNSTNEDVLVSLECLDGSVSPIICMADQSVTGTHVEFDGEYQQQLGVAQNGHPVWRKQDLFVADLYMWLSIESSSWRWVIGHNHTDETTIRMQCMGGSQSNFMEPTECGSNWYEVHTQAFVSTLTSNDGVCDLGDNYVCSAMASDARYRQIHDGIPLWIGDTSTAGSSMIVVAESVVYNGPTMDGYYYFVVDGATNTAEAACFISDVMPSLAQQLLPSACTDWKRNAGTAQGWISDAAYAMELCYHPEYITAVNSGVSYPPRICLNDATVSYSHYQTLFGVYELDNSTFYGGKPVYFQQRLSASAAAKGWYIMWWSDLNAWMIHDTVPSVPMVEEYAALCRSNVATAATPDQCDCWEFYNGLVAEQNCNVQLSVTATSTASDTVCTSTTSAAPISSLAAAGFADEMSLCFDDGQTASLDNAYTGFWTLGDFVYHGRPYWAKYGADASASFAGIEYYLYYDEVWKYWVVASQLTDVADALSLYCLQWTDADPFSCAEWYSKVTRNAIAMSTTCLPTTAPTVRPTVSPTAFPTDVGCSSNYAYVYVHSTLGRQQTIASLRTDFAPYAYPFTITSPLVLFADGDAMTTTTNNPCDVTTWTHAPEFYDDGIVVIEYDEFTSCSPQLWTLNLQNYARVRAVFVGNNADVNHVWSLVGDATLEDPVIPTRMISQLSTANLKQAMSEAADTGDVFFADIACFDTQAPPMICVMDQGLIGTHVELDGEYQQLRDVAVHDHPVWWKEGIPSVVDDFYVWLHIDQDATDNHPWRFVISRELSNSSSSSSMVAQCLLQASAEYIDDPTQCGANWYDAHGVLLGELVSHEGVCNLADNYVCTHSNSQYFNAFFSGRYRQLHVGVPLWIPDQIGDTNRLVNSAVLEVQDIDVSFTAGTAFVFRYTESSQIYAFCMLDAAFTSSDLLRPYECRDWYSATLFEGELFWAQDPIMDVDTCAHPNGTAYVHSSTPTYYPQTLCLMDPMYAPSHYQSYFGVYVLDNRTQYDGRFVYRNQRLIGTTDEWTLVWYEEKDAWYFHDDVPTVTYLSWYGGLCQEDVATPDLCSACWQFFNAFEDETHCGLSVHEMMAGTAEADCMRQPVLDGGVVTPKTAEITLCFEDADATLTATPIDAFVNAFTGKWVLDTQTTYRGRSMWTHSDARTGQVLHYLYYDDVWRYWVMNDRVTTVPELYELYCLQWYDEEPFAACTQWYSRHGQVVSMDSTCTLAPTVSPTPAPTILTYECAEHDKFVSVASDVLQQTLVSSAMNFPPYASETFHAKAMVLFENGRAMSWNSSNPCDPTTWHEPDTYYADKVVLITHDAQFDIHCTTQMWVYWLEWFGAVGVLIANNENVDHVYALSGSDFLHTTIPARMITQRAGWDLDTLVTLYNDTISVSFECFDADNVTVSYPSIVCLVDTSPFGEHVYLDGEYQRLPAAYEINQKPVWWKQGHEGLFRHLYMWLYVNRSVSGDHSWRWVIGTDYNDDESVFAHCNLDGAHVDHPALCADNWYYGDEAKPQIVVSNDTCHLTDSYVCLESWPGAWFEYWFDGRYRQVHNGTALWVLENSQVDAYVAIGRVYYPQILGSAHPYAFVLMLNQTENWAFCVIGDEIPSNEQVLSPWECNENWWVLGYVGSSYGWYQDIAFDIDECSHPDATVEEAVVSYPQQLCMNDASGAYSHYQSYYGVYVLDTNMTFDNRYVYYNQRLQNSHQEWFMLYYDERDAWVMHEMVPQFTAMYTVHATCDEHVATPDLCTSACWTFEQGFATEENCQVQVTPMLTANEADCLGSLPADAYATISSVDEVWLCFDDGEHVHFENGYTGRWLREQSELYNGRSYWYLLDENDNRMFYIYYDTTWRYWILDRDLATLAKDEWHYYCLHWDEAEPFKCATWYTAMPQSQLTMSMTTEGCTSPAPTVLPTVSPTSACNARNAYIYVEWSSTMMAPRTLTSEFVNFPPYEYDTFDDAPLVMFENGRNMSVESSNPCDVATWQEAPSFYADKVVLMWFNDYCNAEHWTLNLQQYSSTVRAVLVANDQDLTHVYALAGDADSVMEPTVPTRLLSEFGGVLLDYVLDTGDDVFVSMQCFDDANEVEYPPIICVLDSSISGGHVYLDGEYQRQSWFEINSHPVWLKTGFSGLWSEMFMYLRVDQDLTGSEAWTWVVGTYDNAVVAECRVNGTHIEHPALCGNNWYVNDELVDTLTSSGDTCDLSDQYVCVEAQYGGLFDSYFAGQYRQIHDGVPLWFHESPFTDIYITVNQITFPAMGVEEAAWAYTFVINQTNLWAFCLIDADDEDAILGHQEWLSPFECNRDWYVMEFDYERAEYNWVIDFAFDVDECMHPAVPTTPVTIEYPRVLCMKDELNQPSHYQSHFGVYILDEENTFDGRQIYYNQRLRDAQIGLENNWFLLWYEEKDAWVLNEMVPGPFYSWVSDTEGICRDDVHTPDLCSACWEFYFMGGLRVEQNCHVSVTVTDSTDESACMQLPQLHEQPPRSQLRQDVVLVFHDGQTSVDENAMSGLWHIAPDDATHDERAYWIKYADAAVHSDTDEEDGGNGRRRLIGEVAPASQTEVDFYMYYDEMWRYWVIDRELGTSDVSLYCTEWYEFEPFNCHLWWTSNHTIIMGEFTTQKPTPMPVSFDTTLEQNVVNDRGVTRSGGDESMMWLLSEANLPYVIAGFVALCCSVMTCIGCVWRMRRNKAKNTATHERVRMDSTSLDGVDLDMVQMFAVPYIEKTIAFKRGTGFIATKQDGEDVASDEDNEDNCLTVETGIDGLDDDENETTKTPMRPPSKRKSRGFRAKLAYAVKGGTSDAAALSTYVMTSAYADTVDDEDGNDEEALVASKRRGKNAYQRANDSNKDDQEYAYAE